MRSIGNQATPPLLKFVPGPSSTPPCQCTLLAVTLWCFGATRPVLQALWCLEERYYILPSHSQLPESNGRDFLPSVLSYCASSLSLNLLQNCPAVSFCSWVLGFSQQVIHLQALGPRRSKRTPAYWRMRCILQLIWGNIRHVELEVPALSCLYSQQREAGILRMWYIFLQNMMKTG